ncbi:MAG TPA: amidohydrolase family protein [Coleofasciculaceae cyanobacterium]|jgi:5-methylthioadenosine/S-adenosylhomocysteine deaminase
MQYLTAQWLLPIASPPVEDGYIAIENGRIAAVGKISDLPESMALPLPVPGSILTPGLVNTHAHLEQSWPEPIPAIPGESFCAWLLKVVKSNMAFNSSSEKAARAAQGIDELLCTGTTCVNDMASGVESLRLLEEKGLRGIVSHEFFHPDAAQVDVSAFVETYHRFQDGYERHPRLKAGLAPHSPYNFAPAAWQALLDACQPPLVHTHLAEFEDEVRYLRGEPSCLNDLHRQVLGRVFQPQETAESPTAYLARYGLLSPNTVLAHAVHTSQEDRALIVNSGASVAHCPRSNLALHRQTLHGPDWAGIGIPMGLGTDGRLSTENLDLRAEARCAMSQHGWTAAEALEALTLSGARVMGLTSDIGSLEAGKWADIVLWQTGPNATGSPEGRVLSEASRVQAALVAGRVCYEEKD